MTWGDLDDIIERSGRGDGLIARRRVYSVSQPSCLAGRASADTVCVPDVVVLQVKSRAC